MTTMPRVKLRFADLIFEAMACVVQRLSRTVLTASGTALGVATFVAVMGLTATAQGQVSDAFSLEKATEVTLQDFHGPEETSGLNLPVDIDQRMRVLNGVNAAGHYWQVPSRKEGHEFSPGLTGQGFQTSVYAASPGMAPAWNTKIISGRFIDPLDEDRNNDVVVLGKSLADRLGVHEASASSWVWIGEVPYCVVGIISSSERSPGIASQAIIPTTTALTRYGPPTTPHYAQVFITTAVGAAKQVSKEAPIAGRPDAPDKLTAREMANDTLAESLISKDLQALFLAIAGITLLVGAVGIANNSIVAVMQRRQELGLRRCLGATRGHITTQILTENLILGGLGGMLGTAVGNIVVICVALSARWTAVLHPWVTIASPFIGATIGVLAGLYPAIVAGRSEPAEAMH